MIDLDAMNKDPWSMWPVDKMELRSLVDEIERLRAALKEVSEAVGDPSAYMIARFALEGEKKDG